MFFRGLIDKAGIKKLFNLTDIALGKDANRLVEGDFKKISFAVDGKHASHSASDASEKSSGSSGEDAENGGNLED